MDGDFTYSSHAITEEWKGEDSFISVDLGSPQIVTSVYIVNGSSNVDENIFRIIYHTLWVGDQPDMTGATYCGNPLGTGTTECESPIIGRYLFIVAGNSADECISLRELRVFGSINMTKTATIAK